jgi:hypothetical protein
VSDSTISDVDATELVLALKRGEPLSTEAGYALAAYVEALQVCECKQCGERHGERCPWLDTCAECARTKVEMHADRLCVDCHESAERGREIGRRREEPFARLDYEREQRRDRSVVVRLTADTITDEQIREFGAYWKQVASSCAACMGAGVFVHARHGDAYCVACQKPRERAGLASLAVGDTKCTGLVREAARARCTEILNARAKEAK